MANEATLVQDLEFRHLEIDVAISGTFGVGAVLSLFDPQLGSVSHGINEPFAGLSLQEKAVDSVASIAVSRYAIWNMQTSGVDTVVTGDLLSVSTEANHVQVANVLDTGSQGAIVGVAMQDAAQNAACQVLVGGR